MHVAYKPRAPGGHSKQFMEFYIQRELFETLLQNNRAGQVFRTILFNIHVQLHRAKITTSYKKSTLKINIKITI